jgi:hypothetical protein
MNAFINDILLCNDYNGSIKTMHCSHLTSFQVLETNFINVMGFDGKQTLEKLCTAAQRIYVLEIQ